MLSKLTSSVKMTIIDHLHDGTEILPVRGHNEKLAKQFYPGGHLPEPVDYRIKLKTKYEQELAELPTTDSDLTINQYRKVLKYLHTKTMRDFTASHKFSLSLFLE